MGGCTGYFFLYLVKHIHIWYQHRWDFGSWRREFLRSRCIYGRQRHNVVVHLDAFDWELSEGQTLTRHSTVERTWVHVGAGTACSGKRRHPLAFGLTRAERYLPGVRNDRRGEPFQQRFVAGSWHYWSSLPGACQSFSLYETECG